MSAITKLESHEQVVTFDSQGKVVVNKTSKVSSKVIARRAIEAHSERKHLEQDFDRYYDNLLDL
ncbi:MULTISPECIES: PA3496 family putative envelope integrity protein [unclassified Oceanobacter]|jgi:hypothetical protein|uniref:PA3496 family putative envelope integrity protein n=1 Tax=unclassified Oceanobacter TaxID=2620260 RepID=UPI0026E33386|nr:MULTISPECIES: hypothetical protein [unclassified Oceanobacter]MDO6683422.1 hypothetical protein [Oceanobacter sp. 5_MG-2023]MDP2506898.1 hypothetical protein [Oceanobacter sp. 3_MG-2023]MDP2547775.1 hypothetical protein [Oceanobacter sp. 4_MG-2023]MDP2608449.1 hypothetical protein [Oceanobacter sp. 1_MG-2023]MDP2611544.1 hypothetical protein [Oceanobacter sp. 2_MG-2023]